MDTFCGYLLFTYCLNHRGWRLFCQLLGWGGRWHRALWSTVERHQESTLILAWRGSREEWALAEARFATVCCSITQFFIKIPIRSSSVLLARPYLQLNWVLKRNWWTKARFLIPAKFKIGSKDCCKLVPYKIVQSKLATRANKDCIWINRLFAILLSFLTFCNFSLSINC